MADSSARAPVPRELTQWEIKYEVQYLRPGYGPLLLQMGCYSSPNGGSPGTAGRCRCTSLVKPEKLKRKLMDESKWHVEEPAMFSHLPCGFDTAAAAAARGGTTTAAWLGDVPAPEDPRLVCHRTGWHGYWMIDGGRLTIQFRYLHQVGHALDWDGPVKVFEVREKLWKSVIDGDKADEGLVLLEPPAGFESWLLSFHWPDPGHIRIADGDAVLVEEVPRGETQQWV